MKVNIANIRLGAGFSKKFSFEENSQNINLNEEDIKFSSPLKVSGEISNAGEAFTVSGELETVLFLICSRCLEFFDLPLKLNFNAVFSQKIHSVEDDIRYFQGDEIILDDVVREALLLELPIKLLCSIECKGLCAQCGKNLNKEACSCGKPVDPRLSVLAQLLNQEDSLKGV